GCRPARSRHPPSLVHRIAERTLHVIRLRRGPDRGKARLAVGPGAGRAAAELRAGSGSPSGTVASFLRDLLSIPEGARETRAIVVRAHPGPCKRLRQVTIGVSGEQGRPGHEPSHPDGGARDIDPIVALDTSTLERSARPADEYYRLGIHPW